MSEKFTLMHAEKANHTIGLMARWAVSSFVDDLFVDQAAIAA